MWPLLGNIFEYISFTHTWEDGTHQTEFKCENCYKIVDIGQINEISYESETYTTGCFTCDRCRKMLNNVEHFLHIRFISLQLKIFLILDVDK